LKSNKKRGKRVGYFKKYYKASIFIWIVLLSPSKKGTLKLHFIELVYPKIGDHSRRSRQSYIECQYTFPNPSYCNYLNHLRRRTHCGLTKLLKLNKRYRL